MWTPVQVGLFAVRSWNRKKYFVRTPSEFPYEGYYDQTAFRAGLEFGTLIHWKGSRLSLGYFLRVLDIGLVAIYNNAYQDLQYYSSSGFTLRYVF